MNKYSLVLLALLAWLVISVPTGLFVVYVMVKVWLEQRNGRRAALVGDVA